MGGCVNTTVSGRTCQAWASTTPHNHGFTSLEENYCRNPDGEPGPWCYTTDSNKRWELCPAPICAPVNGAYGYGYGGAPSGAPSGPPSGAYDSGYGYGAAPSGGAYGGVAPSGSYGGAAPSGDYCGRLLHTCTEAQTSCDLGSSPENCPYGNYCVDMYVGCVGYGGSAPGVSPSGAPAPSMAMAPNGAPSGAPSPSSGYDYGAPGVSPSGAPSGAYGNVCLAQCYDQDLDPQGATYDGCVNTTVSGRTCQAWASTTPHNHGFTSLEENYCRNPDGEPGPWCYTTDSSTRWELCETPICAAGLSTTTWQGQCV